MLPSELLATKLHRPALPVQWVPRPHLNERLDQTVTLKRKMTLVSAPAGFGKTTCICSWLLSLTSRPVAWLSLEPADDDPARFFTYLVAALQQVDAILGKEISGVLRAGQLPPGAVIAATLVNDIVAAAPFVLVLDDFHVIQDRFILQVLETLIANLPQTLHLVLITREDPPLPLARLRANNQLTEIRARDLRFDGKDAATFLNEAMGLSLIPADIARLEAKTEGWVAGLQLAGLALQTLADPSAPSAISRFITTLSGSHRFILNYLTEQVLNQQPEDVQTFLLQTAILDKLNGDLCDAVTGRPGSQIVLERLYRANLFLIALDDERRWYRYHHLFADLLRDRLSGLYQDDNAELHRRASRWYAAAGGGGAFASAAIEHALAAADYEMAVGLLEQHGMELVMQGYAQTVNGWVQALPPEWRAGSPRTELAFAWMHLLRGAYAEAAPYLERTRRFFGGEGAEIPATQAQQTLKAEWLVMRSLHLFMEGKALQSMALANQALELAPETDGRVRSLAYWAVASVQQLTAAYTDAAESYRMAIQYGRAADNALAEMMAISGLAQMALEQGQLQRSFEIAIEAVERIERTGILPPISALAYGVLAQIYYEWHELDQARRHGRRALELSTLGGYNSGIAGCRAFLARLYQLEADLEMATGEIQKAVDLVQGGAPAYIRQEVVAQQVRVYLAQGRLAAAQIALQGEGFSFQDAFTFPQLPDGAGITHSSGLLYNSSLYLLLAQSRAGVGADNLVVGMPLADRIIAAAQAGQYRLVELAALLWRAQMHAERGSAAASAADYAAALKLAEPEGFVGIFLDQGRRLAEALAQLRNQNKLGSAQAGHAARILDAFSRLPEARGPRAAELATSAPPGALVEPLTERELEVLNLMAEGMKYQEIGTRLFISLNTVRFHVKAIYGKLGVHRRGQAVETARQLGIL